MINLTDNYKKKEPIGRLLRTKLIVGLITGAINLQSQSTPLRFYLTSNILMYIKFSRATPHEVFLPYMYNFQYIEFLRATYHGGLPYINNSQVHRIFMSCGPS